MKRFSAISKDVPEKPIDRAIWWTEYVLRHNGAHHLRSAVLDLYWYQYLLLDVIAAIILISLALFYIINRFSKSFLKYLVEYFSGNLFKTSQETKKVN